MREGYKKTEIGVIPLDWEVVKLGKNIKLMGGYAFKSKDAKEQGTRWLKIANVGLNRIKWEQISYLDNNYQKEYEKFLLNENDIVLAMTRPILSMKLKIAKITKNDIPALLNQRVGKFIFNENVNSEFMYQLFQHIDFVKLLMLKIMGTDPPNVSSEQFETIKIPLPPLKEQKKIAKILSTADKKIEAIALQIEKAERVKKGLMQRLLSDESWEIKTLDSVATITMGQSPKSSTYNQEKIGIPLIQGNADCKNRKTVPRTYTTELTKECFVGDIIMTVRAPVGAISKSLHNACIGRGVCSIKPNEENEFLYHFLVNYEDKWDKLSQGSTFTAVSGSDIRSIKLFFPPLKEQTKIANILSTADEKLEVLRAKKVKYEELKVGLMQKLLTGEVRV